MRSQPKPQWLTYSFLFSMGVVVGGVVGGVVGVLVGWVVGVVIGGVVVCGAPGGAEMNDRPTANITTMTIATTIKVLTFMPIPLNALTILREGF
ncbi:MAG: hypothetical protein QXV04_05675, partial [Desulfurococcaceae archaeon]